MLGVVALLALVVPLGLRIWLSSESGRESLARGIEYGLSEAISGSVTIGRVEGLSSAGVIGHDIRFMDEDGHTVLEARDVELEIDWGELLQGHFVSHRGRARGGRILLQSMPSGQLRIDAAFKAPHPGPPGQPIGPDVVRLERLAASDLEIVIDVRGAPDIHITRASAICLVRAPDHGAARLRADRVDGEVRIEAPIPIEMSLSNGTLTLIGDARQRCDMRMPVTMGGQAIQMNIRVIAEASEQMHVNVHLRPADIGGFFTGAPLLMQGLLAGVVSDSVDVTLDMP